MGYSCASKLNQPEGKIPPVPFTRIGVEANSGRVSLVRWGRLRLKGGEKT